MNEKSSDPKFFASDDLRPFVAKFLIPGILIGGAISLVLAPTTRPAGVGLCAVFILIGALQFGVVGLVKPTDECVFYKRFLQWRRIEYSDIVRCGRAFFPPFWGLHYLRLRNFEPPLGKLYFVQYHPARPFSQHELDQEMIEQIHARIAGEDISSRSSSGAKNSSPATSSSQAAMACAISAILPMLAVVFLRVLLSWPGPNFPAKVVPGQHIVNRLIIYLSLFGMRLLDWPYNSIAIVVLLAGIGILRFKGNAVTLSAVLGAILGGIAARWLGAS